ncbi:MULTISPECIES: LysM peptidoglycan-binding domain-containing protein [unclassified Leifsonia]|uniref:LysM peptidoglycan-binding domain-containing protein n=1 Tax=unclassified Leifsonia TaxID=2663824 RepID=UPI000701F36B|nr:MULTISPECIES: LysM domain-containing protein [unclassified Leifsonia]KQX07520.1 hypothetical protein ASC59_07185 [Leifsonia sp. Root1293]KRA11802.1 hypothetical protein ASD61_07185 [Leifsonia sp. Root60]
MIASRTVVATTFALTVAAALVACSTPEPPAPPVTVVVTVTPKATPTPTPTPAADPPAPQPSFEVVVPVPNAPAPEVVEGPASDLGARDGATAAPETDGNGALVSYTVVAGDSFFDIAQRFDLPQQQLLRMNPNIPDFGEDIYIGTVINLDWTKTG